jgi:hypothetical protein
MMSQEVGKLQAERDARNKTELEKLRASSAAASGQAELLRLEREHSEARFQAEMRLRKQRHQMRLAKQQLLHENAMDLERLRKEYPLELKRQREEKERQRQAEELNRLAHLVIALVEQDRQLSRRLFLAAFGAGDAKVIN